VHIDYVKTWLEKELSTHLNAQVRLEGIRLYWGDGKIGLEKLHITKDNAEGEEAKCAVRIDELCLQLSALHWFDGS
jgi:hypothetical protein